MRWVARGLAGRVGVVLCAPAVAGAHATIVRTSPADAAVVAEAPRDGDDPLERAGRPRARVRAAARRDRRRDRHATRPPHAAAITRPRSCALPAGLEDGTYVVAWRVTSADSHPVSGAFSFSIGQPSRWSRRARPARPRARSKIARRRSRAAWRSWGSRWPSAGRACCCSCGRRARRARAGGGSCRSALGALMFGSVALLLLQGPYTTGGGLLDAFKPSLLEFSLSTRFGQALVVRLLLTLAFAVVGRARPRQGRSRASGWARACSACSRRGRSPTTRGPACRRGSACPRRRVHLLAMALWLGGLALLLVCVLRPPPATLEPVVPRFSQLALGCFGVLGVTGVYLAWRQSGELAALPATEFGRLLLIKSGIVLVIIGLAWFSRRAVARAAATRAAAAADRAGRGGAGRGRARRDRRRWSTPRPRGCRTPSRSTSPSRACSAGRCRCASSRPSRARTSPTSTSSATAGGCSSRPRSRSACARGDTSLPVELTDAEPGHYVATAHDRPVAGRLDPAAAGAHLRHRREDAIDVPVRIR